MKAPITKINKNKAAAMAIPMITNPTVLIPSSSSLVMVADGPVLAEMYTWLVMVLLKFVMVGNGLVTDDNGCVTVKTYHHCLCDECLKVNCHCPG